MKLELFAAALFLALLIPIRSSCHYSCQNCTSLSYTSCSSCPNNSSFTYKLSFSSTAGTCAQLSTDQANGLGITLIIIAVCFTPIFMAQQIVHLLLFLQTLGLFYLLEVYYIPTLDYTLSGCSYFMLISKMTRGYKKENTNLNSDNVKGRLFFGSFSFISNIAVIGVINVIAFFILFFLPLFKNLRKKCVAERVQFCPDWLINKIVFATSTVFIFLIQQTVTAIYFSLKTDQFSVLQVILTILYFFILIAFTINQFFYPFIFFRNKFAQINMIIAKAIMPLFLITPVASHFIAYPLIITFYIIDAIATNKNKNSNSFNRLFAYKIFGLLLQFFLTIYYVLEISVNDSQTSKIFGYICFVGIFGILSFLALELIINVKSATCNKNPNQQPQLKDITMDTIEASKNDEQRPHVFMNSSYLQDPKSQSSPQKHNPKADSIFPGISNQGLQHRKSVDNFQNLNVHFSEIKKSQNQLQVIRKQGNIDIVKSNSENFQVQQHQPQELNQNLQNVQTKEPEQNDRRKRLAKRKKDKKTPK